MLILGEVHTGLLQHSCSLPAPGCEQLLSFVRGEPVRRWQRPIPHATSPDLLVGVDCELATGTGARVRGAGTVRHRATVTGGRVVQGSAMINVVHSDDGRRRPWSHYLARPGELRLTGRADLADLAGGFLRLDGTPGSASVLDLGAVCARVVDRVQASPLLDRTPPFRAARTMLRWVASPSTGQAQVSFGVAHDQWRTLRVACQEGLLAAVVEVCEDLALHDWLLTTLLRVIERSQLGTGAPGEVVARLRPAIDHLLHLWMPAARVDLDLLEIWQALELRPGFSRQWRAAVDRIRDQIAVGTITLLTAAVPEVLH